MTLKEIGAHQTPEPYSPIAALVEAHQNHNTISTPHLIEVLKELTGYKKPEPGKAA